MMSYDNSVFRYKVYVFVTGFSIVISIDIVLTLEFRHDIRIWKTTIVDKVD